MKKIVFSERARADIRALSRETAMVIFEALHRFAETGQGDTKKLKGDREELRLRIGDYRVFFVSPSASTIEIRRVLHRKDAYR
ncbi:MAG TPA: type II toxin-antitoxin system RelE/ParE family toxin [Terriglobia bacterium]|nr:type II toxin-antitoxin system RelE/ParE family toxin [Terriglobia bacterium]